MVLGVPTAISTTLSRKCAKSLRLFNSSWRIISTTSIFKHNVDAREVSFDKVSLPTHPTSSVGTTAAKVFKGFLDRDERGFSARYALSSFFSTSTHSAATSALEARNVSFFGLPEMTKNFSCGIALTAIISAKAMPLIFVLAALLASFLLGAYRKKCMVRSIQKKRSTK